MSPSGRRQTTLLAVPAVVACLATAGCGGEDAAPRSAATGTVSGSVDGLERSPGGTGGPPDAGTAKGHGDDAAALEAKGDSIVVSGTVRPASATVRVIDARSRKDVRTTAGGDGRFSVEVDGLEPGPNVFRLEAASGDRRPWTTALRIVRR